MSYSKSSNKGGGATPGSWRLARVRTKNITLERDEAKRERERETLSESESVLVDSVIEKRQTSGERRVKSFFLFFFSFLIVCVRDSIRKGGAG